MKFPDISVDKGLVRRCLPGLGLLLGLFVAGECFGQTNSPWRFWNTTDGFEEAYTNSLARGPGGSIWVKHGAVGRMNRIDGYATAAYPDPGSLGKVEGGPEGTAWMWVSDHLERLEEKTWVRYPVKDVGELGLLRTGNFETWLFVSRTNPFFASHLMLAPLDRDRVLIMLPDRVLEYDARTRKSHVALSLGQTSLKRFAGLRTARAGAVYLSGFGGAGSLHRAASGIWNWEALPAPPLPYVDFEEPIGGPAGSLLVTGVTPQTATAALSFDGRAWHEIYKGTARNLRAWGGVSGAVWVQDGDHIVELAGGSRRLAERNGALSGILLSIMPESAGRFWVASSQGIGHYMPPLWQTPPDAPPVDDVVSAITEDRSGNLWFLAAHQLLRYDNAHWSSYPLPKGATAWAVFTDGLAQLPDGRLAIRTTGPDLLLFDPATHEFVTFKHPQGRRVHMFAPHPNGTILVETFAAAGHTDSSIEMFDGSRYTPYFQGRTPWHDAELRSIMVGSKGELWVGGMGFLGVSQGTGFTVHNAAHGYGDSSGYYIHQDRRGQISAGGPRALYRLEGNRWKLLQAGLDRVRNIITTRDGTFWVSSGTGIHRFKNGIWLQNGEEEGLPSSVAYKVFEDSRGRIWAGTTRGIGLYHGEADVDAPMAILTENQNQHEAPPGGRMRLVFSGVDKWKFTQPSRLLYSYRLDSETWSDFAPVNSASFDKLPAGAHRFEVRAMDRNGNISRSPAVHRFTVLLPWYLTAGFCWSAAGSSALIVTLLTLAWTSYSHRGRLIGELKQRGQLERDSQTILQMIAAREPLPLTLQRIADLFAAGSGAACIVFRDDGKSLNNFPAPAIPVHVRVEIRKLKSGEWWEELSAAVHAPGADAGLMVPVRSGDRELLGAIALFPTTEHKLTDTQTWLEAFGELAGAAMENARLYERLEHQARHDALTGLPNRLYFEDRLRASVNAAKLCGNHLAVLYLDLDRFKHINDTFGHRMGDLLLCQVGARLCGVLKPGETLCRIGGDEFTVLVEDGANHERLEQLAAGMLSSLRAPILLDGQQLPSSASIGIAIFPEDGETPASLQKHADSAMYKAKAAGKNRIEFFSAELLSSTAAAMNIEQLLRRSLDQGLFKLYYQPQFTLAGDVAGYEALLRMQDANGVFVSPAEFIPIAEETGLIIPIGAWVLRTACAQLRSWRDAGLHCAKIAINVSALQLSRPSFADEVAGVLAHMGVDPQLLELELTESSIMDNLTESKRQMEKLRAFGVGLAIDDFGTGYSSLAYLQNLPINVLKIDRSFIHAISGPSGGLPMVQAILALARNLGLTVVAEGVETQSQLAALHDIRCDLLQGYLLCKPQPASKLMPFLTARRSDIASDDATSDIRDYAESCSPV